MKTYDKMTKAQLLECLAMASEDAHADAKRQRWTKPVLIEWLNGFAELTDEPITVAEEPEPAETTEPETAQTDSADTQAAPAADGEMTFTFNGEQYSRKVKTYARSGRRWARVAKSYVEVLPDGSAIAWKD